MPIAQQPYIALWTETHSGSTTSLEFSRSG